MLMKLQILFKAYYVSKLAFWSFYRSLGQFKKVLCFLFWKIDLEWLKIFFYFYHFFIFVKKNQIYAAKYKEHVQAYLFFFFEDEY